MQKLGLSIKIQKIKNLYHLLQALLANIYYGFPGRKLKVIGVTGTDGKTTTTHLIYHILRKAGKKVSMISSVYAKIAGKEYDTGFHVTTPSVFPLQRFLAESVKNKDEYFVLETTSHALDQNRVWGINFEVGVLTNITHEHLDYHGSYYNYLKAKLKLLKKAKIVVINKDDQSYNNIKYQIPACLSADRQDRQAGSNIKYYLYQRLKIIKDNFPDLAKFNQYNYSAAYTACKALGIESKKIIEAMKTFSLPAGRYEIICKKPFIVIIDFAHTPNALEEILREVRKKYIKEKNKLIHVFGSAGKRDKTKRPTMGEVSGTYADFAVLTEEDYRDEDPVEICHQIAIGLKKKNKPYLIIIDRKKAIEKAFEIAKKGDVIIATGKGHEKSLCRGNREYLWDEKKTILELLKTKHLK